MTAASILLMGSLIFCGLVGIAVPLVNINDTLREWMSFDLEDK